MESNATKSKRRRRQIRDRDKHNAARRLHYKNDSAYREAKKKASRRQNATMTLAKKGELSERRCAKRFLARLRLSTHRSSWQEILDRQYIAQSYELENPHYVIEIDGEKRHEQWPLRDIAWLWLEHNHPKVKAIRERDTVRRKHSVIFNVTLPPTSGIIATNAPHTLCETKSETPTGRRHCPNVQG